MFRVLLLTKVDELVSPSSSARLHKMEGNYALYLIFFKSQGTFNRAPFFLSHIFSTDD